MPIAALLPLLVSALGQAPQIINEAKSIWKLATDNNPPTPEQKAEFDAASAAAHKAVQDM